MEPWPQYFAQCHDLLRRVLCLNWMESSKMTISLRLLVVSGSAFPGRDAASRVALLGSITIH